MKTIDEMIAVMERARDGAKIQARVLAGGDWTRVINHPLWAWDTQDYRVEPVTRTMDVYINPRRDVTDAIADREVRIEKTGIYTKKVTITWEE